MIRNTTAFGFVLTYIHSGYFLEENNRGEYFLLFGDNYHGTGLKFDPFSEKF